MAKYCGDITKLKMVVWDLDETFWKGTIDDGDVPVIPASHISFLQELTNRGIVNSICSKNDWEKVKRILEDQGVLKFFVFPSVNWQAKGPRIESMLRAMGLRACNVLFIDDNHLNLEEVEYIIPGIMTAEPVIIPQLIKELANSSLKTDLSHKRLQQYKVLETKVEESKLFGSNKDFLISSKIKVEMEETCSEYVERIHELVLRSNQLNFTKKRSTSDEIKEIIADKDYRCGIVKVSDRFGDYGMVGFYAIKNNKAEHFLFSCRTIGMGIEQYVYQKLKCPQISIVGDVISELGSKESLEWINIDDNYNTVAEPDKINGRPHSVLLKGPCDMNQIFNFIQNNNVIDSEFTYVDNKTGIVLQGPQHLTQILESLTVTEEQKRSIAKELPFASEDFFDTNFFDSRYHFVFLSLLHESHLGIYKRKSDGIKIVFGESAYPLTDEKYFDDYINQRVYTGNCKFDLEFLKWFSQNYEFCGHTRTEELEHNILEAIKHLNKNTKLILMLGVEYPCAANNNPAFNEAHLVFSEQNRMVRKLAKEHDQIEYIYYGDFFNGQEGFYSNIYHFTPTIYYKVAQKICEIINENGSGLGVVSEKNITKVKIINKIRSNRIVQVGIKISKKILKSFKTITNN